MYIVNILPSCVYCTVSAEMRLLIKLYILYMMIKKRDHDDVVCEYH